MNREEKIDAIVEHEAEQTYGNALERILKYGVVGWNEATDEEIDNEYESLFGDE